MTSGASAEAAHTGRTLPALIALALVAALAALAGCNDDTPPVAPQRDPAMLFRLARFDKAALVDGGEVSLAGLQGRVVLLDLFGTWCPPCRRSTPVLVSLYERFSRQGLEIVGLAYEHAPDEEAARTAVRRFRDEFRMPYVLALGTQDLWEDLRENAAVQGVLPTTVLLDRQGVVRGVFEGFPSGHEAVLADRIERLLAEPVVSVPPAE